MAKTTFNVKHSKHPKISRQRHGTYARHEVGFFGASCSEISTFVQQLVEHFHIYSTVYVDADHSALDNADFCNRSHAQFAGELIDQQGQFTVHYKGADDLSAPDQYSLYGLSDAFDLALINANHFCPEINVLLWRPNRADKVRKRQKQLSNCRVVLGASRLELPEDISRVLDDSVVFMDADNLTSLAEFICKENPVPKLNGLILAGGASSRMGRNKAILNFHGKPQYLHLADLLSSANIKQHLSVANENDYPDVKERITDRFNGLGPFGAILSAFMHGPDSAWFVLACDLPLVDVSFINELIAKRNPAKLATAFLNPETGLPDPLCTIWEPKAYSRMLAFMARGYSCPRKLLINSNIELVESQQAHRLMNVNTPEELKKLDLE